MNDRPKAHKYQTLLAEKRDRVDRARALLMLEEILNDDEEELFQASQELGLPEILNDEELEECNEFVVYHNKGSRYLLTKAERLLVAQKKLFALILIAEHEAFNGIFHDAQMVAIERSPMKVVMREFFNHESARKRLVLIANREGYEAERAWLLAKLT